jgi:hypothetical protein
MKFKLSILIAFFILCVMPFAYAETANFYESLDSSSSISANSGSISGSISFVPGVTNNAGYFNAASSVHYANSIFNSENGSVSIWFKKDAASVKGGLWQIGTIGTANSLGLFYNAGQVYFEIRKSAGAVDGTNYIIISSSAALSDTNYNNIIVTWQKRGTYYTVKMFVNGIFVGGNNFYQLPVLSSGFLDVGYVGYYNQAAGSIDEVRFFNRQLSDPEIYAEYIYSSNKFRKQPTAKPVSTGPVKIISNSLNVNGQPFLVKGVGYEPVPVGSGSTNAMYSNTAILKRDMPILRAMGVNTVRLWQNLPDKTLLDYLYNNGTNPIYAIVSFDVPSSVESPTINYKDAATITNLENQFKAYVNLYKNHPAVLAWAIGNENNLHYTKNITDWYVLANKLAKVAYEAESPAYHPTMVINGYMKYWGDTNYKSDDISMNYTDVWGHNSYTGYSFDSYFDYYNKLSAKPLVMTEFGVDAYSHKLGSVDQNSQANWNSHLWSEIKNNSAGGTLMAYSDEWWKYKPGSVSLHEIGGYLTDVQPDGYSDEEYWGVVSIADNGTYPDIITPRQTYYALKNDFKGPNLAPNLNLINNVVAYEGDIVQITPTATDPNADILTFSFSLPLNASGKWQTKYGDNGIYNATVTVSDGNLSDSQSFLITITPKSYNKNAFLKELANDTYSFLNMIESRNGKGLPDNWYNFDTSSSGAYTSPEETGFYMLSHVGAYDMGLTSLNTAKARIQKSLDALKLMPTYTVNKNTIWSLGDNEGPPIYDARAFDEFDQSAPFNVNFNISKDAVSYFPKEMNDWQTNNIYITFKLNATQVQNDQYLFLDTIYATHKDPGYADQMYFDMNVQIKKPSSSYVNLGTYKFGSGNSSYPEERYIKIPKENLGAGYNTIYLNNAAGMYSRRWLVWDSLSLSEVDNKGLYYRYYNTNSLSPTDMNVPSIGNAMLAASLITIKEWANEKGLAQIETDSLAILDKINLSIFYDKTNKQFYHDLTKLGHWDYYSDEGRILSLTANALGAISDTDLSNNMNNVAKPNLYYDLSTGGTVSSRTAPEDIFVEKASWDGSMFTYIVPALFIQEKLTSYQTNTINPAVLAQIKYSQKSNYKINNRVVWGISDAYNASGLFYCSEFQGAPPTSAKIAGNPYESCKGLITPHASALALLSNNSDEAIDNLYNERNFKNLYHDSYGFRDSFNALDSNVFNEMVTLDQEWIFLSLMDHMNGTIWKYFYSDPRVNFSHNVIYPGTVPQPECRIDNDCNSKDKDYCSGTEIKHDEGKCVNYACTVQTTTTQNCNDGLYCNGAETCNAASCVAGTTVDCTGNNLPAVSKCNNNPDNNLFTLDTASSFTSSCNEASDSCAAGTYSFTHVCSKSTCSAQCEINSDCVATECDTLDACVGNDYYDYSDVANTCLGNCSCEQKSCTQKTILTNDARCTECQNDNDCNSKDNDYCSGTEIKHDEGKCVNYACTVQTTTTQNCNDGLYCNGAETCLSAACVSGTTVDCTGNSIAGISACNNIPDGNIFTWDYFAGFTSACNEASDSCTTSSLSITHACSKADCAAECESNPDCSDTDCDLQDGCVGYDYYDYADVNNDCLSNCSCESNACVSPAISVNDSRCYTCSTDDDCNMFDRDYCSGSKIKHDEGKCASTICSVETTETNCNDGLYCNGQETCNANACAPGTAVDCSSSDISQVETCTNNPDNNAFTWDYFSGFVSTCEEATDSCTTGTFDITHSCSISDCSAECESDSDCSDVSCDHLDGCYGTTYRDYTDSASTCANCRCEGICSDYTESLDDPGCVPTPDLVVKELKLFRPSAPKSTSSVVFKFVIENIGNAAATDVNWMLSTSSFVKYSAEPVDIEPGQEVPVFVGGVFNATGTFDISAFVDYDNLIAEPDESNNQQQITQVIN